jgi:hypothetical protein
MSQEQPEHISKKTVVYTMEGVDAVTVRRDQEYRGGGTGALTMDLYYPPDSGTAAPIPAVVFVIGFSDLGAERILGCKFKQMGSYVSWARLAAASGLVAITYTNREPEADLQALLRFVRDNAAELGIDRSRIGIWACSGNGPMALSILMEEERDYLKCAALCYPYTLDLDGSTGVARAAKAVGFVNPCAGKSLDDLPREIPLFIARAGQDQTLGLNESLDRFLLGALNRNLPITLSNHPEGPHAFDLFDDSAASRRIIEHVLGFLRSNLLTR